MAYIPSLLPPSTFLSPKRLKTCSTSTPFFFRHPHIIHSCLQSSSTKHAQSNPIYFATCARGLGPILSSELTAAPIDAEVLQVASSGVYFQGKTPGPATGYRALLWLRTAIRVLEQLSTTQSLPSNPYHRLSALYTLVRDTVDWSSILASGRLTFSVRVRVSSAMDDNERIVLIRIKDAICDALRDDSNASLPERPSEHAAADVSVFVALHDQTATVYLDLAGNSLHKRGFRPDGGVVHRGGLNETVAAGMLYLGGMTPDGRYENEMEKKVLRVVDPMCGGGTLLLEAALLRLRVAVGLYRPKGGFAVERGISFERDVWEIVREEAIRLQRKEEEANMILMAGDCHKGSLKLFLRDVKRLRLEELVSVKWGSAREWEEDNIVFGRDVDETDSFDLAVCNPPWGRRIEVGDEDEDEDEGAWDELGKFVKKFVKGGRAVVLCGDKKQSRALRMRAKQKTAVRVGNVDTRVLVYDVHERREGTEVGEERWREKEEISVREGIGKR